MFGASPGEVSPRRPGAGLGDQSAVVVLAGPRTLPARTATWIQAASAKSLAV